MEETSPKQPIDLRDVLRPVTSRLWLIVIVVALATALTYYHYNSQPKLYRAATNLYIGSTDPTQIISPLSSDRANTDLAALVASPAVARIAAKKLGFKGNPEALVGAVIASPATGSDFISISTVSENPVTAANLVNAFADAFIASRTDELHAEARAAIDLDQRAAREAAGHARQLRAADQDPRGSQHDAEPAPAARRDPAHQRRGSAYGSVHAAPQEERDLRVRDHAAAGDRCRVRARAAGSSDSQACRRREDLRPLGARRGPAQRATGA